MSKPTSADWLHVVIGERFTLETLIERFHPRIGSPGGFKITAWRTERRLQKYRDQIKAIEGYDPMWTFRDALENRDVVRTYKVLCETWIGLPESVDVERLRGFGLLCNLLDSVPVDFPPQPDGPPDRIPKLIATLRIPISVMPGGL